MFLPNVSGIRLEKNFSMQNVVLRCVRLSETNHPFHNAKNNWSIGTIVVSLKAMLGFSVESFFKVVQQHFREGSFSVFWNGSFQLWYVFFAV